MRAPTTTLLARAGWLLVGVGLAASVAAGVIIVNSLRPLFDASLVNAPCSTPCMQSLELGRGHYLVFEQTGSSADDDPSGSTQRPPTTKPKDVSITSPKGQHLKMLSALSLQTINKDGENFDSFASFHAPGTGRYRIAIDPPTSARALVAPDLGQSFAQTLHAFVAVLISGSTLMLGLLAVVGVAIRRTAQT